MVVETRYLLLCLTEKDINCVVTWINKWVIKLIAECAACLDNCKSFRASNFKREIVTKSDRGNDVTHSNSII